MSSAIKKYPLVDVGKKEGPDQFTGKGIRTHQKIKKLVQNQV